MKYFSIKFYAVSCYNFENPFAEFVYIQFNLHKNTDKSSLTFVWTNSRGYKLEFNKMAEINQKYRDKWLVKNTLFLPYPAKRPLLWISVHLQATLEFFQKLKQLLHNIKSHWLSITCLVSHMWITRFPS